MQLEDLSWMSINLHGARAEVLVREKLPEPSLRDEVTPAHVVAAADGIISHMEVLEGQPNFQEGDAVLSGEVVISGIVDLKEPMYATVDAGQRTVHARGNVWARTWRVLEAEIPLEAPVKSYTGEKVVSWTLVVLGRSMNIFGKGGISQPGYDKITTTHTLTLPGGQAMPLSLRRTECRAYETVSAPLDWAAAEDMLKERLAARLKALAGEDGEIVETEYTAREADGMLIVTLKAECREQIGRERPFAGRVGDTTPPQPLAAPKEE